MSNLGLPSLHGELLYSLPGAAPCLYCAGADGNGKFHRFLFPFSSKFSDLNFASYVFYNLPVLCHVSRTVSLGYL